MNEELRELIDGLCDLLAEVGKIANIDADFEKVTKMELAKFIMYLSASDGEIGWDEVNVVNAIFDFDLTPSDLARFIRENNIYSTEFEQTVPVTFQLIVAADNEFLKAGLEKSGSEVLLDAYKSIGEYIIKLDENIVDSEKNDYRIYVNMLEEYRNKNYNGARNMASGFVKSTSASVSAPTKNGVAAPRKG